jgi:hypothetical protein
LVDPRAHGKAPHLPGIEGTQRFGRRMTGSEPLPS